MASIREVVGSDATQLEVKDFPVTATIISFLPYELNSSNNSKPGLLPSYFFVPAVFNDDFVVVPITDCRDYVYLLDGKHMARWVPGVQVAGAIVRDHIMASISVKDDAFPGLKALPGKFTKEEIKANFSAELADLLETQKRWFGELAKAADDIWNDPNQRGKHKMIGDLHRHAARYLKLNREWMTAVQINLVSCVYCKYNIPSDALICMNCKMEQKLTAPDLKKVQSQYK